MLILVDQHGVLADFERGFYDAWVAGGPPHPAMPLHARKNFHVNKDYPAHLRDEIWAIHSGPEFFRDLPPIEGAIDGMAAMLSAGHDVRICTSPLSAWRNCVSGKFDWVERHLGTEFVSRMILTRDMTLVHGDLLIDDKPDVTGARHPNWRHVIFDQPYNREVAGARMTWADWRNVVDSLEPGQRAS